MPGTGDRGQVEVFSYLSVVTSIILGLGLAHLLTGYAQLIHAGGLSRDAWIYSGWILVLLPVYVIYWWSFWDYRMHAHWTFVSFFLLLAGPVGLYFLTALLLPGEPEPSPSAAGERYLAVRSWIFALWVALQVWGILLAPWLRDGCNRAAFLNRYKYAQYLLLAVLVAGLVHSMMTDVVSWLDAVVLITFWAVLAYLVTSHRRSIAGS